MAAVGRIVPVFVVFLLVVQFSIGQSNFAQNIETFYPGFAPEPAEEPIQPPVPSSGVDPDPIPVLPPPAVPTGSNSPSSDKGTIAKAVAATAASTLVVAAVFFFFIRKYSRRRKERGGGAAVSAVGGSPGGGGESQFVVTRNEFNRVDGNLKGIIVDEDGLDVLYWRKLEEGNNKKGLQKQILDEEEGGGDGGRRRDSEPIQEIPLLRGKSSSSHIKIQPEDDYDTVKTTHPLPPPPGTATFTAVGKQDSPIQPPKPPQAPPPPPPLPVAAAPLPPPPPKKNPAPPPPPPKGGGLATSLKPPPGPKKADSSEENGNGQVKLKPLHWDKVNRADHSMVWDRIEGGSFRFDGDLMEALFGSVAANKKSPERNEEVSDLNTSSQITILDPRKSQNTAIILKSLAISRRELLDALVDGQGLDSDALEKLSRMAPSEEEQSKILEFSGDSTKLADAESFLFHLLKAVPSAFKRLDAMLFKTNYDVEVVQVKQNLKTLEAACKELRTRGLFMKLLEAILKAGNRMNAGTARGNAQAFKLTALRKLSDVKSTDGKTTLLHFVVEEVVRFEGKRCTLNRNHSLSRSSSRNSNSSFSTEQSSVSKEEKEREYIMLGLPVVGGLSAEFSNVKKAAAIDYEMFSNVCSLLTSRVAEMQNVLNECSADGDGKFVREMKCFLNSAKRELDFLKDEQRKVMEIVRKTTEYYQAGASIDQGALSLQLFVVIKDFLGMVDRVCIEIARNLQKRKISGSSQGSQSPQSTQSNPRTIRFPNLPAHFLNSSSSSSSDSDTDS